MTAADWLIFGLVCFCLMCLLAIIFGRMINTEWSEADAPTYRTADAGALDSDVRRIQAQVPDAPPRHKIRAGAPSGYDAQRPHRKPDEA